MAEDPIRVGDRVEVFLDRKSARAEGWFDGTVIQIDPYSEHRSFYWVEFGKETAAILGFDRISVFNPRNIKRKG